MCPNIVQKTVAAVDLASAQLAQRNTSCLRNLIQSLGVIHETALNATITLISVTLWMPWRAVTVNL